MGNYTAIGILGIVGGAFSVLMVKCLIETLVFLRVSRKVSARVVQYKTTRNNDGLTLYIPVVEFKTAGGTLVRAATSVASNPPAHEIGETVEVRFLPKNPKQARIDSFSENWLLPAVFALFGFFCFFFVFLMFHARWN